VPRAGLPPTVADLPDVVGVYTHAATHSHSYAIVAAP